MQMENTALGRLGWSGFWNFVSLRISFLCNIFILAYTDFEKELVARLKNSHKNIDLPLSFIYKKDYF